MHTEVPLPSSILWSVCFIGQAWQGAAGKGGEWPQASKQRLEVCAESREIIANNYHTDLWNYLVLVLDLVSFGFVKVDLILTFYPM